ncbi:MAG: thiamine diphosphokinase [Ignavibacteriae bacterium]|nr:thiamine diphosphokinase [Ignavibacteriota bacterium]
MKEKKTIIFLNGDAADIKSVKHFYEKGDYVIAADGGANNLLNIKTGRPFIIPNIILGDLDSLKPAAKKIFKLSGVEIRKIDEQETTDFEKALMYAIECGFRSVIVFGGVSARPDHTLNNFSVMKRFSEVLEMRMIDKDFEIFYAKGKTEFTSRKGETVSMMGMPSAHGISTRGLIYGLKNETLEFGVREGTLNKSKGGKVTINYKAGDLLIFRKWKRLVLNHEINSGLVLFQDRK